MANNSFLKENKLDINEREFPDLVEWMKDCFKFYNEITSSKYYEEEDFERIYENVIKRECNLIWTRAI